MHGESEKFALKAGCPYERAFMMVAPLAGVLCSRSRIWTNELFLIPPVVWFALCLDSGANKSGIINAVNELVTMLERKIDEENKINEKPEEADPALDDFSEYNMDDMFALAVELREADTSSAASERTTKYPRTTDKNAIKKAAGKKLEHRTALSNDEGSLVAFGITMAKNW